jgi:hypothetical protein
MSLRLTLPGATGETSPDLSVRRAAYFITEARNFFNVSVTVSNILLTAILKPGRVNGRAAILDVSSRREFDLSKQLTQDLHHAPSKQESAVQIKAKCAGTTSPNCKFLVASGTGATVIPSGSWLHELDEEDFARNGIQKNKREAPPHYFGLPSVFRLRCCFSFDDSLRVKTLWVSRICDPYGVTVSGIETTASSFSALARDSSFSRRDCWSFNPWPLPTQISDRKHSLV